MSTPSRNTRASRALATIALVLAWTHSAASSVGPDTNFHSSFFARPNSPSRALLLPNEKYLVFFATDTLTDQRTGAITRFLSDGTLDTSFQFDPDYNYVSAAVAAGGGKIYIAAKKSGYGEHHRTEILRLNDDGSADPTFPPVLVNEADSEPVYELRLQPDGKLLVSGFFTSFGGENRQGIVRLLTDGSIDPGFAPVAMIGAVYATALQLDGKILIGGSFNFVNDTFPLRVARLNSNGSLDTSFTAAGFSLPTQPIRGLLVLDDGKVILSGRMRTASNQPFVPLLRLNADGNRDTTFILPSGVVTTSSRDLELQSDGKILAAIDRTLYRFNTDGSVDNGFTRPLTTDNTFGTAGSVFTVDRFADGDILIGGGFTDINGSAQPSNANFGVARLNPDGTLDASLATVHQSGFVIAPHSFSRRPDNFTYISFGELRSRFQPVTPFGFGRLLADGSRDAAFTLSSASPAGFLSNGFVAFNFAALSDGGFFIFGGNAAFAFASGKASSSGTEDTGFAQNVAPYHKEAIGLPEGKVLLSADDDLNATLAATLTRLRADGTADDTFQFPTAIREQQVRREQGTNALQAMSVGSRVLAVLPDQKLLFEYFTPGEFHVVRLHADGSLDGSFTEITFQRPDYLFSFKLVYDPLTQQSYQVEVSTAALSVRDAAVQPDGRLVLATRAVGSQARGLMRIEADGTFDPTFNTGGGAQWVETTETANSVPKVEGVVLLPNGKFLIVGTFEAFDGNPAPGIALLNANGSFDPSFVAPALRNRYAGGEARLERQDDGSFLLGGPYYLPGEPAATAPSLIRILAAPAITSALTAAGNQNQSINYQITATGAPTSFGATGLPASLSINITTGLISGTPTVNGIFHVTLSATNAVGTANATLTLTIAPGGTVNISTRLAVGTGDNVLIGGLIITGDAPKKILVRALGPSLTVNGSPVPGRLLDPVLELRGESLVVLNDDWRATQEAEIAAVLPPNDDRESAIIAVVNPGAFTAVLRGKNGSTGVGLVEVYDLGNPTTPSTGSASLVNISTRGLVQTGDNVMIGGFIITGAPTRVIVRAIGPDLTNRGIPGALPDTTIELFDANGIVAANDDWRTTQEQEIIATTVPPNDNRESAIVRQLPPGGYTAVVRGKNGATGVALVEVYALP